MQGRFLQLSTMTALGPTFRASLVVCLDPTRLLSTIYITTLTDFVLLVFRLLFDGTGYLLKALGSGQAQV